MTRNYTGSGAFLRRIRLFTTGNREVKMTSVLGLLLLWWALLLVRR